MQEADEQEPDGRPPIWSGHISVAARDTAVENLRTRLVNAGASTGTVLSSGALRFFRFTDPDGWFAEVVWHVPAA